MFIFVRRRTIKAGKLTQALDFAIESSAHVGKVIGKTIAVQRLAYGQPAGVLQFSYLVDQMSELDETVERIASDAGAAEFANRGAELFEGLPEDNIGRVVVSTFDGPKPVMSIVSAVGAPGKLPEVTAFGVEMQELLASTTGEPAAFVIRNFGTRWRRALRSGGRLDGRPSGGEREAPRRWRVRQADGANRRALRPRERPHSDPAQDQLTREQSTRAEAPLRASARAQAPTRARTRSRGLRPCSLARAEVSGDRVRGGGRPRPG